MGSRTRRAPSQGNDPSTESQAQQQGSQGSWLSDLRDAIFGTDASRESDAPALGAPQSSAAESGSAAGMVGVLAAAETELATDPYDVTQDMHVTSAEGGDRVTLEAGSTHTLTADDAGDWDTLARNLGTTPDKLIAFNEDVENLDVGTQIYIPSAEERLFVEYRAKYTFEEAVSEFYAAKDGTSVSVYEAASDRATGDIGESYGTAGIDGRFYTPNTDISGASSRNSEEINGQTEYKVFWVDDFWKCSIFMNDAVWQGGYEPALSSNNHYSLAGRAHQRTDVYSMVDVANARPGDAWQRFGGTGSNDSHNAILSSFVEITEDPTNPEVDIWEFKIIGAEEDRAAESTRTKYMNKGTNETVGGEIIRFLRPTTQRSDTD